MKDKVVNLDAVNHILNCLKNVGNDSLNFETQICILDTAKQLLLYQKTMRSDGSFIPQLQAIADQA